MTFRRRAPVVAAAVLAACAVALGSPGDPDASFDGDGRRVINVSGAGADALREVLVQPDGRIVLAGDFDDPSVFLAIRLRADGAPDTSFAGDSSTFVDPPGADDTLTAAALQPDGKLLLAGRSGPYLVVARLDADGTPDDGFGNQGFFAILPTGSAGVTAIAPAPGGRILVAAFDTPPASVSKPFVFALTPGGRLDDGFGAQGVAAIPLARSGTPSGLALRPDGSIVAGGLIYDGMGRAVWLARLGPDGSLPDGFGTGGVRTIQPAGGVEATGRLAVQPDGRTVIAVTAGGEDDWSVLRVGVDGADDQGFGDGGRATVDLGATDERATALAVQADGKIVVVGGTEDAVGADRAGVARLQPGGAPDTTFSGDGRTTIDLTGAGGGQIATAVALAPDGGIVVGGLAGDDLFVARLEGDPVAAGGGPAPTPGVPAVAPGPGGVARAAPRCDGRRATIVGTPGRDVLRGTPRADVIAALGGADVVRGLGGADVICGGGRRPPRGRARGRPPAGPGRRRPPAGRRGGGPPDRRRGSRPLRRWRRAGRDGVRPGGAGGRRRLGPAEVRRPALAEGPQALPQVLRAEGPRPPPVRGRVDRVLRRAVLDGPHDRPRPGHGERGGPGHVGRGAAGGLPEPVLVDHLVDQPDAQGLVGIHRRTGQEQAPGPRRPHRRHEPPQPVGGVDHPEARRGHAEPRPPAGDAPVARDRELERPAERRPVEHADHGHGRRRDRAGRPAQPALALLHERGQLVGRAVAQVQAGGEVAVAGAGQQHDGRRGRPGALQ